MVQNDGSVPTPLVPGPVEDPFDLSFDRRSVYFSSSRHTLVSSSRSFVSNMRLFALSVVVAALLVVNVFALAVEDGKMGLGSVKRGLEGHEDEGDDSALLKRASKCTSGQYTDNGRCFPCAGKFAGARTCTKSSVSLCASPWYLRTGRCVLSCAVGTYASSSPKRACIGCTTLFPYSTACTSKKALSCRSPRSLVDGTCVVAAALRTCSAPGASILLTVPKKPTLFVGGFGGKIHTLSFNPATAALVETSSVEAGSAPSWVTKHGDILYSADAYSDVPGSVSAFKISPSGSLSLVSKVAATGQGPVSLAVAQNRLFVADYDGGVVDSLALVTDGSFISNRKLDQHFDFKGTGLDAERQDAPHPHQVALDPTGKFLFVPDLGLDQVHVFLVSSTGLTKLKSINVTPGSGPRHLIFHRSSTSSPTLVYLVAELTNTVSIYTLNYPAPSAPSTTAPTFTPLQPDISVLPKDQPTVDWGAAELAIVLPNHLVVSNRAVGAAPRDDSDVLTLFRLTSDGLIDSTVGPTFKPVWGRHLRHFSVSPCHEWLALGAQNSNDVIVFKIGRSGGGLQLDEVARAEVSLPSVVIWA